MKANAVLLVLYYWFHNSVAQRGLQCFVPGECLDSQILGATPTNNSRECWRHCQSTTGCTWFTFYKDSQVCTPLSGCLRLSNKKCQDNCVSGEEECPEVQCGVHGRCYGALEGIRKVANAKECATICRHREECFWNTFDPEHESCLMTNDCPLLDRSCSTCSSSERDCIGEIDANTSTNIQNEDNSIARKNLVFGTTEEAKQVFFNLDTKTTEKCWLPVPMFSKNVQYAMVSNAMVACSESKVLKAFAMIFCYKLHVKKKGWLLVDSLKPPADSLFYFLSLPSRGILILTKSKFINLFDGRKFLKVSDGFPYTSDRFKKPFCLTAVSKYQILVGFSSSTKNGTRTVDSELRIIDTFTGAYDHIKPHKKQLMNSICGAFGPESDRKVAIFGGEYLKNGEPTRNLNTILILHWKSRKIEEIQIPSLKFMPNGPTAKTVTYQDTFLYFEVFKDGTLIYKFDPKGTDTPMPFLGEIPGAIKNLAEMPDGVASCK